MAKQVINLAGFTSYLKRSSPIPLINIDVPMQFGKDMSTGTSTLTNLDLVKRATGIQIFLYGFTGDDLDTSFKGSITIKFSTYQFKFEPTMFTNRVQGSFSGDKLLEFNEFFDQLFRTSEANIKAGNFQMIIDDVLTVDQIGVLTAGWDIAPTANKPFNAPAFTDPDGGVRNIRYTWAVDSVVQTETSSSYTPTDGDVSKFLSVSIKYDDNHGINKILIAKGTKAVKGLPDDQTGALSAWPANLQVELRKRIDAPTVSDPDGGVTNIRYQWQRKDHAPSATTWADITGANADHYIPAFTNSVDDSKMEFRVIVTYDDAHRKDRVLTSEPTPSYVADDQPGSLADWTVSPLIGVALAAPVVTDPDGGVVNVVYNWLASSGDTGWVTIATNTNSYTPVDGDVGKFLRVEVTYSDSFRSDRKLTSKPSVSVASTNAPGSIAPWRDDQVFRVGERLVAPAVTDPDEVSNERFQWEFYYTSVHLTQQDEWRKIDGATDQVYLISSDYQGYRLRVIVTYDDSLIKDLKLTSQSTSEVLGAVVTLPNDKQGSFTGTWTSAPQAGQIFTGLSFTDPDGGVKLTSYEWWISDTSQTSGFIHHKTAYSGSGSGSGLVSYDNTYTPTADDVGKWLQVRVTYDDTHRKGLTLISDATSSVVSADQPGTIDPWPDGQKFEVGTVITAPDIRDPDNVKNATYVWQRKGTGAVTRWVRIAGATASTYTPVVDDEGYLLRVRVTYDDDNLSGLTLTSQPSTAVQPKSIPADQSGILAAWSGAPLVGTALSTPKLTDPDGGVTNVSYDWYISNDGLDWTRLGVTTKSYTPKTADGDKFLRVQVDYDDTHRTGLSITSTSTARVFDPTANRPGSINPWPSAQEFKVGSLLTVPNVSDPDNVNNRRYQWQQSSDDATWTDITSERNLQYVVAVDYLNRYIRVRVTYDDSKQSNIVLYSATTPLIQASDNPDPIVIAPNDTMSAAIKEAYASAPAGQIILETIELRHPNFSGPQRIVRDNKDLAAGLEATAPVDAGKTVIFTGYAFSITLPPVHDRSAPETSITLDNVSLDLLAEFEKVTESDEPVKMTYRPYLSTNLSGPQYNPPLTLTLKSVAATASSLQITAGFGDYANKSFPSKLYTYKDFPGLLK